MAWMRYAAGAIASAAAPSCRLEGRLMLRPSDGGIRPQARRERKASASA